MVAGVTIFPLWSPMSMRSIPFAAVGGALLASLVAPTLGAQQPAAVKIAFLRSQAVVEQAPGRADAEAVFRKEVEGYRSQLEKMGDTLQKMIAEYRKVESTLAVAQKQARELTIRAKQEEMQKKQQGLEEQARGRQVELMQPITDMVKKAIDDVRTEEGWTVIFDVETQANPIVSIDKNLDVTDRVIAKLRLMPKPVIGGPAAAAPKSDKPPVGPVAAPAGISKPKPPAP